MKSKKKYVAILFLTGVAFFLFWWGKKEIEDSHKRIVSFHKVDDTIVYFTDVEDEPFLNYVFPEELASWIGQSLTDGNWKEKLNEISIKSKVLSTEEKKYLSEIEEAEDSVGIPRYCDIEPKLLKDKWHMVSLSQWGDDIVIESYDGDGYRLIYFFPNIYDSGYYSEVPMLVGINDFKNPYFICWEGINYMALPIFDEKGKKLLGIEIHDYHTNTCNGVVTGIKAEENGTWSIKSQEYFVITPRYHITGKARFWPTVVSQKERW